MTTIFVVFVSFGGVCFIALASFALWFVVKKSKCSKTSNKQEMVHVDEHVKVKKNIVQGLNGMKAVSITVDDDLHVDEEKECIKNEKIGKNLHHDDINAQPATSQV
ncbi:hypothetical protein QVD17_01309 [Tagetes erecta]|uniref:Uncharacterized protein n=1 Tax=Tagetes erecta TaxID=13708 RepID=A0AAD8P6N1_TARER|nr:hypothetical protein QVD17_01309 [Tagetes erecta]